MSIFIDKSHRFVGTGTADIDVQAWKTEKLADLTFEYHAFVGLNPRFGPRKWRDHGAIFMVIRITDPNAIEATQEYYMGRTGLTGDADDTLTTAWANRASLNYKRYDQMLEEFFN